LFDEEPEWIDGLNDDASVAAVDSSQSVPTAEPNPKKRKATAAKDVRSMLLKQFIQLCINIINTHL